VLFNNKKKNQTTHHHYTAKKNNDDSPHDNVDNVDHLDSDDDADSCRVSGGEHALQLDDADSARHQWLLLHAVCESVVFPEVCVQHDAAAELCRVHVRGWVRRRVFAGSSDKGSAESDCV
jgi:hypothetical protein